MTEFKKGDPVVTAPGVTQSLVGTPFPERSTGVIVIVAPEDLGVVLDHVRDLGGRPKFVALGFDQVEHATSTPTPLDPSKEVTDESVTERPRIDPGAVKAGDLVAVDIVSTGDAGEYMVAGRVYRHSPHGPLFVGGHALVAANVTLTNHEPAPEPERDRLSDVIFEAVRDQPYSFADGADQAAAAVRAAFVVIDPATADAEALSRVLANTDVKVDQEGDPVDEIWSYATAIANHLGIEA